MNKRIKLAEKIVIPGSREELEKLQLETLAGRHFAYNKEILAACMEAIVAMLAVDRQVHIKDFGSFSVALLPNKYRIRGDMFETGVVFTPDVKLIKYLEGTNVKI